MPDPPCNRVLRSLKSAPQALKPNSAPKNKVLKVLFMSVSGGLDWGYASDIFIELESYYVARLAEPTQPKPCNLRHKTRNSYLVVTLEAKKPTSP